MTNAPGIDLAVAPQVWTARRTFLHALGAPDGAALAQWLQEQTLAVDDVAWLTRQGLGPYAFFRLEQAGLVDRLPGSMSTAWEQSYQQAILAAAAVDWEIDNVLAALEQAGVDFIWLKGSALAYAVYPNPACRMRGDLDLWIDLEALQQASSVLNGLGYHLWRKEERPEALTRLTGGEHQMVRDEAALRLIELQWPALRGEWVRHTTSIDHESIWRRRTMMAMENGRYWTMAPEDTLIHLCVHQAINHQFGRPWLRNLLDVHLLAVTGRLDWSQMATSCLNWRLATVVWTVLELAQRLLGTPLPAETQEALAPTGWRRRLIEGLHLDEALLTMKVGGHGHGRFVLQLALVDRPGDGVLLLLRGLAPEPAWLRARYGLMAGEPLWPWRIRHVWRLATSARA